MPSPNRDASRNFLNSVFASSSSGACASGSSSSSSSSSSSANHAASRMQPEPTTTRLAGTTSTNTATANAAAEISSANIMSNKMRNTNTTPSMAPVSSGSSSSSSSSSASACNLSNSPPERPIHVDKSKVTVGAHKSNIKSRRATGTSSLGLASGRLSSTHAVTKKDNDKTATLSTERKSLLGRSRTNDSKNSVGGATPDQVTASGTSSSQDLNSIEEGDWIKVTKKKHPLANMEAGLVVDVNTEEKVARKNKDGEAVAMKTVVVSYTVIVPNLLSLQHAAFGGLKKYREQTVEKRFCQKTTANERIEQLLYESLNIERVFEDEEEEDDADEMALEDESTHATFEDVTKKLRKARDEEAVPEPAQSLRPPPLVQQGAPPHEHDRCPTSAVDVVEHARAGGAAPAPAEREHKEKMEKSKKKSSGKTRVQWHPESPARPDSDKKMATSCHLRVEVEEAQANLNPSGPVGVRQFRDGHAAEVSSAAAADGRPHPNHQASLSGGTPSRKRGRGVANDIGSSSSGKRNSPILHDHGSQSAHTPARGGREPKSKSKSPVPNSAHRRTPGADWMIPSRLSSARKKKKLDKVEITGVNSASDADDEKNNDPSNVSFSKISSIRLEPMLVEEGQQTAEAAVERQLEREKELEKEMSLSCLPPLGERWKSMCNASQEEFDELIFDSQESIRGRAALVSKTHIDEDVDMMQDAPRAEEQVDGRPAPGDTEDTLSLSKLRDAPAGKQAQDLRPDSCDSGRMDLDLNKPALLVGRSPLQMATPQGHTRGLRIAQLTDRAGMDNKRLSAPASAEEVEPSYESIVSDAASASMESSAYLKDRIRRESNSDVVWKLQELRDAHKAEKRLEQSRTCNPGGSTPSSASASAAAMDDDVENKPATSSGQIVRPLHQPVTEAPPTSTTIISGTSAACSSSICSFSATNSNKRPSMLAEEPKISISGQAPASGPPAPDSAGPASKRSRLEESGGRQVGAQVSFNADWRAFQKRMASSSGGGQGPTYHPVAPNASAVTAAPLASRSKLANDRPLNAQLAAVNRGLASNDKMMQRRQQMGAQLQGLTQKQIQTRLGKLKNGSGAKCPLSVAQLVSSSKKIADAYNDSIKDVDPLQNRRFVFRQHKKDELKLKAGASDTELEWLEKLQQIEMSRNMVFFIVAASRK